MASSADRITRVILRYEVDRASAQEAAESAKALSASLNAVGTSGATPIAVAKQLDHALSQVAKNAALDKLASEMARASREGKALDDIIRQATADLIRLDAKAGDVNRVARGFTGEVGASRQADERKVTEDARRAAQERIREAQQLARLQADADQAKAARFAEFARQEKKAHQERLRFQAEARKGPLSDPVAVQDRLLGAQAGNARAAQLDQLAQQYARMAVEGKDAAVVTRELSADLARLGATAAEVDRVANAFDRAEKEARDLAAAEDELLSKNLAQIGVPQPRPSLFQGGRLQGGALGRLGSELRLLPSVQIPGANIGTDQVANLIRLSGAANTALKATGISMNSLGVAAGVAAPLVVGLSLVITELGSIVEDGRNRINAAIDSNRAYYEAVQNFTTEQAQARIQELREEQDTTERLLEDTRRGLETGRAAILEQFRSVFDVAGILAPQFAGVGGGIRESIAEVVNRLISPLDESIPGLEAEALTAADTLLKLEQAIAKNEFAANDAAVQLDRLGDVMRAIGLIELPPEEQFTNFLIGVLEGAATLPDKARAIFDAFGRDQTQTNLDTSAQVGDDFNVLQNALTLSAQGVRDLAADYEQQAFAADLSRQALQATGDTSVDATNAIKAYTTEADNARAMADQLRGQILADAEAREAELAVIERTIAAIDRRVALEVQAFNVLQTGTVESVDARIGSLNAEIAAESRSIPVLAALARTNKEYQDDLDAAKANLVNLNNELNVLATLRPDVAARQFREESEKLALSLVKDIQRIEAARDSRIAEIEANLGNKEAELAKTRSDAVTDAEEKAAAKRIDALEDFREAEARINRKFNRDYLTAVGERDALAAFEAKQQRDDDLAEARAKLDKQTAAIDKSLKDQQKVIEKRYADQLQTARDNARRAIDLERQKASAEINLKVQAYNTEIANLRTNLFAQNALMQQFWAANIAIANRAVAQVYAQQNAPRQIIVPNSVQLPPTNTQQQALLQFQAYQRNQGIPGFASGLWNVPQDNMLARLHRGEMVVPERQARVIRERGGSMGGQPTSIRLKLDGTATTRLLEGKAVDVYVAIEGNR